MFAISTDNISLAWAAGVRHLLAERTVHIAPFIINLSGFPNSTPLENDDVRNALEALLAAENLDTVHTVANTVFPESLLRAAGGDRHLFFRRYINALPRYKKLEPYKNGRGLYFDRLINFGRGPMDGNQLEFIITSFKKGVVDMKLQASLFDPERDLTPAARIGFPCLQQISFVRAGGGLAMNAFYATQLLIEKAYGNMLGLSRLGRFVARELGMQLTGLTVYVGNEKFRGAKRRVQHIVEIVADDLENVGQFTAK